jgi:glycosyltransferase involved in cell wall biosynthesis
MPLPDKNQGDPPLFSIIVPMYNVEQYINDCLISVLNQSFSSVELIVVDDESDDKSVSNCQALIDQGSNFLLLGQKHAGPNVARNHAITFATGKYILFMDADDKIIIGALERLHAEIQRYSSADVISFGYIFFDDTNGVVRAGARPSQRHMYSQDIFVESLIGRDFGGVCWNKCYKRDFLLRNNILFVPDRIHGRDLIYSRLVAYYADEWRSFDAIIYESRIRSGSFSRNFSEINIYSAIDVASKHLDFFSAGAAQRGVLAHLYYAIHRHLRYIIILGAFRSRNYSEFKIYYKIIEKNYLKDFSFHLLTLNDIKISNKAMSVLIKNPLMCWISARILKKFKYEPY